MFREIPQIALYFAYAARTERAEAEVGRLRRALRGVIFDLHNCQYGGDMPRCEHIADALKIARAVKPYEEAAASV